jgi:GTP-binding protein
MTGPREDWRVVEAAFEQSAASVDQCPDPALPEIAIAGRSNVGKSSLINALCGRRGLARTSRTPGRTQLLNLFHLRLQGPDRASVELRCVDLPGYGYAAATRAVRMSFAPMIEGYLSQRETLRALVLLVDLRRGLVDADLQLMQFVSDRALPTLLVGTKADKLGASERNLARGRLAQAVGASPRDVLITSASTGVGLRGSDGLAQDLAMLVQDEAPA